MIKKIKKQHGFTLIEIMMAVVLLGILGGTILYNFGDLSGVAKEKVKKSNAQNINHLMSTIHSIGGEIGKGAKHVDTTNAETLISSFTKTPPLLLEGVTFSVNPAPKHEDYYVELKDQPYETLHPIENKKN
jgi:prepilin-type N-terminal cleavage/methylation domain-containing protein